MKSKFGNDKIRDVTLKAASVIELGSEWANLTHLHESGWVPSFAERT